jgi:hypothetical protein
MSIGASQILDRDERNGRGATAASSLPQEAILTAALQLGWRVAELYAQVNDTGEPSNDTLLPAHESLEPEDQLELQLRAAAGDARRAGVVPKADGLEQLLPYAREAPSSPEAAEVFRSEVHRWHVELAKDLWARDEAAGKAYELGNGMSDTYSRICRAYRVPNSDEPRTAWESVFNAARIERLKKLLDDLQSRLNPGGVAVVRHHLDVWRDNVPERIRVAGPPPLEKVRKGLRRQTVIWRQLITGDKEPEAYLDSDARAELRGDLRELVWRRCRRWMLPAAAVLFLLVLFLPQILNSYDEGALGAVIASLVAVAGALGITKATMLVTIRTQVHQWSELLWNRAVAKKVSDETLVLDSVLPLPFAPPTERRSFVSAVASFGEGMKERMTSRPRTMPPSPKPGTSF